jgi:hypothetical protein
MACRLPGPPPILGFRSETGTGGMRDAEEAAGEKKCPRLTAATITTLTAATGEVLTGFVGFRSANLGHT